MVITAELFFMWVILIIWRYWGKCCVSSYKRFWEILSVLKNVFKKTTKYYHAGLFAYRQLRLIGFLIKLLLSSPELPFFFIITWLKLLYWLIPFICSNIIWNMSDPRQPWVTKKFIGIAGLIFAQLNKRKTSDQPLMRNNEHFLSPKGVRHFTVWTEAVIKL